MTKVGTFRRQDRLRKTGQFRRVYDVGGFYRKEFLILRAAPQGNGPTRIGISISSRDIPLASTRNRLKRTIREAYRRNKARLLSGYDLVVIVKGKVPGVISLARIEGLFSALCAKAKIVR